MSSGRDSSSEFILRRSIVNRDFMQYHGFPQSLNKVYTPPA